MACQHTPVYETRKPQDGPVVERMRCPRCMTATEWRVWGKKYPETAHNDWAMLMVVEGDAQRKAQETVDAMAAEEQSICERERAEMREDALAYREIRAGVGYGSAWPSGLVVRFVLREVDKAKRLSEDSAPPEDQAAAIRWRTLVTRAGLEQHPDPLVALTTLVKLGRDVEAAAVAAGVPALADRAQWFQSLRSIAIDQKVGGLTAASTDQKVADGIAGVLGQDVRKHADAFVRLRMVAKDFICANDDSDHEVETAIAEVLMGKGNGLREAAEGGSAHAERLRAVRFDRIRRAAVRAFVGGLGDYSADREVERRVIEALNNRTDDRQEALAYRTIRTVAGLGPVPAPELINAISAMRWDAKRYRDFLKEIGFTHKAPPNELLSSIVKPALDFQRNARRVLAMDEYNRLLMGQHPLDPVERYKRQYRMATMRPLVVTFHGVGGYDWQRETAIRAGLVPGKQYTVLAGLVGRLSTALLLEGVPGNGFNSVMFSGVDTSHPSMHPMFQTAEGREAQKE